MLMLSLSSNLINSVIQLKLDYLGTLYYFYPLNQNNILLCLSIIPLILMIRMKRALNKVSGKFTTFERLISIETTFKIVGIIQLCIMVN